MDKIKNVSIKRSMTLTYIITICIIGVLSGITILKDNAKTKIKALSGGMKRRLGIAQALLHNPGILIVDEPTAGLDPEERIRFRKLLSDFAHDRDDRIVLLSTHIVSDIESTCDGVAVLNDGRLIFHGSTEELIRLADGKGKIQSPALEDGYMYLLHKIEGGVRS